MSYKKHNFESGQKLFASQLNEMDEQIAKNELNLEDIQNLINPSHDGMRTLGRCLLWYDGAQTFGNTNEEIAEKLSKYDLVVGVQNTYNSIKPEIYLVKAKELNPNIKIFGYIATASIRDQKMLDDNYNWDPSFSDVPIQTKWQMLQNVECLAHIGGTASGKKQFIEAITYTKDGEQVTEDKYVDLYEGGFTPDGIFWDEFDYDNPTSCKNQGFKNIREKHNYLLTFARARGMCSMANAWSLVNELSDEVNDINPEGLCHEFTNKDFFLLESQETRNGYANEADGMKWMPINAKMYDYYRNYYSEVGAKCVAMSYCTWSLDDLSINRWRTWCTYNTLVQGGHYICLWDRMSISNPYEIPKEAESFYYSESESYKTVRVDSGQYRLEVNGKRVETKLDNNVVGKSINSDTLDRAIVKIDGCAIADAFSDVARYSSAALEQLNNYNKEMKSGMNDFDYRLKKAEADRESNMYNRMFIDDWIDKPKYTNLLPENALYDILKSNISKLNKLTKNEDGTITFNLKEKNLCGNSSWSSGTSLMYAFPNNLYKRNIIVGFEGNYNIFKYSDIMYTKSNTVNRTIATKIYAKCDYIDDDKMYTYAFIDTNNLNETYKNPYHSAFTFGINLECELNKDYTIGELFAFDINEEFPDYTKTNYTNINNPYINQINNRNVSTASLIGRDATVTWKKGATYSTDWWSTQVSFGFSFKVTPGHSYEVGYESIETNTGGCAIQALTSGWSAISGGFKKGTSIDKSTKYFTTVDIDELSSETTKKIMIQIGFPGAGNPVGSYIDADGKEHDYFCKVKGMYVYDKDEKDVIIRGDSPSNAYIMISRVTKETFRNDIENDKLKINTLYIIRDENNQCSLAMTDIGGHINYFKTQDSIEGADGTKIYTQTSAPTGVATGTVWINI